MMVKSLKQAITGSLFLVFVLLFFSCQENENPGLDSRVAIDLMNVAYSTERSNQLMDIYLPANRNRNTTKVFVWIHGGAWIDGNKSEFRDFKPWLEEVQDDYAYVAINYSLFNISTRSNRFPTQEKDIQKAVEYIKSQLISWDVSDNVVLAGASAGGHLALLHSYKNNQDNLVKATVVFFPPTDLASFYGFNALTNLLLENLLGGNPGNRAEEYFNSSPINFIGTGSVPTVFFHGDKDTVVPISQSKLLEDRLKESAVPFFHQYIPGQGHGFDDGTYKNLILKTEVFLGGVLN